MSSYDLHIVLMLLRWPAWKYDRYEIDNEQQTIIFSKFHWNMTIVKRINVKTCCATCGFPVNLILVKHITNKFYFFIYHNLILLEFQIHMENTFLKRLSYSNQNKYFNLYVFLSIHPSVCLSVFPFINPKTKNWSTQFATGPKNKLL